MSSVPTLMELTPAQRRELLKMALTRDLVWDRPELPLADIQATFDLEISIRTVFSMSTLEAMAGEIERRIYEDVFTMPEFEAEQLAASNPVAGA